MDESHRLASVGHDQSTVPSQMPVGPLKAAREVLKGRLPARYSESWEAPFFEMLRPALVPGCHLLDIGSGARPTIESNARPPGTHYVGLDISDAELRKAPQGSYDEIVVSDICVRVPSLEGRFDAAISHFTFEHIKDLKVAIENIRSYLKPGGVLVSHLAGGRSVTAMLNRVIPHRLAERLLRPSGREPGTVFKAYYDNCTYSGLSELLEGWSSWTVEPRYLGASYWGFSRWVQAAYVGYEQWSLEAGKRNLATYYLISAEK